MSKKIRVLHTFNSMNRGGAETLIMNVFRKIDRDKFEFDFLCEKQCEGAYDNEIRKLGGRIFYLRPQKKRPFKNLCNIVTFLKKTGPYDVIHIPNMFYSGVYCIAAKIAGIKTVIVHSHNAGDSKRNTIPRFIYKVVMRCAINCFSDVKVSCGNDAAIYLFGNNKNVLLLKNGIDVDAFSKSYDIRKYKKEFDIKNEKVIINVARFTAQKNHEFFIKLGKYIKDNAKNYKILLIGDGDKRKNIERRIKSNGLSSIIKCAGVRSDTEKLYCLADVFVMPSLYEGFPVSVIEALASSTPCVLSSNIDNQVAVIPDYVSFVNLNDDPSVWMKVIEMQLRKKGKRHEVGDKLKDLGYDIMTTVRQLESLYDGGNIKNV